MLELYNWDKTLEVDKSGDKPAALMGGVTSTFWFQAFITIRTTQNTQLLKREIICRKEPF